MKIKILSLILIICILMISISACTSLDNSTNEKPIVPNEDPRYKLIFYDDFNILNPNIWTRSTCIRRGGYWHEDQVFVEDGNLTIRTEYKEEGPFGAAYYTGCVETDALLNIPFGRYEIRFKTQRAKGYWNAIWLMQNGLNNHGNGAMDGAEIDLIEIPYLNNFQHMIHIDAYDNCKGKTINKKDIADTWHLLIMDWTPDKMTFYMDNVLTWELNEKNWISQVNDGNLLISCEINGKVINDKPDPSKSIWGGVGNIKSNVEEFINDFLIDYVKIYDIDNKA